MALKRSFIQMPITQQMYVGLLGMTCISCLHVFLLLIISLFVLLHLICYNIQYELDKNENNAINGFTHYADLEANLFLDIYKRELTILRMFINNVDVNCDTNDAGETIDTSNCGIYVHNTGIPDEDLCFFRKLFLARSLVKVILKTTSYNFNDPKPLLSYIEFATKNGYYAVLNDDLAKKVETAKQQLDEQQQQLLRYDNFDVKEFTSKLVMKFLKESVNQLETLNYFNLSESTYNQFITLNPTFLLPFNTSIYFQTPMTHQLSALFNTNPYISSRVASFEFAHKDSEAVLNKEMLSSDQFDNYIGGIWSDDIINTLSDVLTTRYHNLYLMLVSDAPTKDTLTQGVCKLLKRLSLMYSPDYDGSADINETLLMKEEGVEGLAQCFLNKKARDVISREFHQEDRPSLPIQATHHFTKKISVEIASYKETLNYEKAINAKIYQYFSPSHFIRSLTNSQFFSSLSFYLYIIKISNNLSTSIHSIKLLFFDLGILIVLSSLLIWIVIAVVLAFRIRAVSNSISAPINQLIQNISNKNTKQSNSVITYKDDKDINDLFKLCQVLISGGFSQNEGSAHGAGVNVYNNVTIVKSNNMMINEYDINSKKDEDYKLIFGDEERGSTKDKHAFQKEVYNFYDNERVVKNIKEYVDSKVNGYEQQVKNEINKHFVFNDSNEYALLYVLHKEVEEYVNTNNLYKVYCEEVKKKEPKKQGTHRRNKQSCKSKNMFYGNTTCDDDNNNK